MLCPNCQAPIAIYDIARPKICPNCGHEVSYEQRVLGYAVWALAYLGVLFTVSIRIYGLSGDIPLIHVLLALGSFAACMGLYLLIRATGSLVSVNPGERAKAADSRSRTVAENIRLYKEAQRQQKENKRWWEFWI